MARLGIQYTQVKQTAIKLLSQGIAPSVQTIRDALGTGSHTTIAQHLKVWREEHQAKAIHHLPANMPNELISAIEVLWQTAMEQAENQLAAIKKDLNEQQGKLREEKLATDQTISSLKATILELQQKYEEKSTQLQSLHTELAVAKERLAQHPQELMTVKNQYEERLKLAFEEKNNAIEKLEILQAEIIKLQQQLSEQAEKQQAVLLQERALQEQSETRWAKIIDQARTESKELRKNYEIVISKQNKQIEALQNDMANLQSKHTSQQSALHHAKTISSDLKEQLNQLQGQHNEAIGTIAVLKEKLEEFTKKKSVKKQKIVA